MKLFLLNTLITKTKNHLHYKSKIYSTLLLEQIANGLYNLGFIFGYTLKNKKIIIYVKRAQIKIFINNIKIYSKPSKFYYISYYQIENLIIKNPRIIFFLSTSFGVLTNNNILLKKQGGVLLFSIF